MDYKTVLYEPKDQIAWVTLNRPKVMNAMNIAMVQELGDVVDRIEEDKGIRVVIIRGGGDKAFSAGADLKEIEELGIRTAFDYSRGAHRLFNRIEQLGKPVIACINGNAMGAGAELALSCHIRTVSETATLSFPESGLGGIPGMGGSQRLPRLIGKSLALYYLLTGDVITAQQGSQVGLYHKVFSGDMVLDGTEDLAKKIARKSPLSTKFLIQAVTCGSEGPLETGLVLEAALMSAISASEDKKEGIKAIFEKRSAHFKGE